MHLLESFSILKKLIPFQIEGIDLMRIGRNMDGGYLVPKNTILDCDAFISGGIEYDLSFEEALLAVNPKLIYCFDPTIEQLPKFLEKNATYLKFYKKALISSKIKHTQRKNVFSKNKIDFDSVKNETDLDLTITNFINSNNYETLTFSEIIKENNLTDKKLGIKIDIEGGEYDILRDLNEDILKNTNFLVIEFHLFKHEFYRKYLEIYLDNISKYFTLVHIHGNNCSQFLQEKNFTYYNVFECTFINNSFIDTKMLKTKKANLLQFNQFDRPNDYQQLEFKANYPEIFHFNLTNSDNLNVYFENDEAEKIGFLQKLIKIFKNNFYPFNGINIHIRILYKQLKDLQNNYNLQMQNNFYLQSQINFLQVILYGKEYIDFHINQINYYKDLDCYSKIYSTLSMRESAQIIVTQGCGIKTLLLANILKLIGKEKLYCIEHDELKIEYTTKLLKKAKLDNFVEIIYLPLITKLIDNYNYVCYDIKENTFKTPIDIFIPDRNTEYIQKYSFVGNIIAIHPYLNQNHCIYLNFVKELNYSFNMIKKIIDNFKDYKLNFYL